MTDEIVKIEEGPLSVLLDASRGGLGGFSAPFSGEILVFHDVLVAGTRNVFNIDEIVEELKAEGRVRLLRDPENLSNKWAVKVLDAKGREFGFLSADCTEAVARLMDAGKAMFAKVQSNELRGEWYMISLEVYLDD